ncbi:hypothetical protein F5Y10DRAFT_187913 [Nemania abortiva]|nr:hypothetical protein F5Y10DRAFT_187913 [Nemania abortiva]
MAQPQVPTICDECTEILRNVASFLASESDWMYHTRVFDSSHQAQIANNVSLQSCQMCIHLGTSIPRLLEPLDPEEILRFCFFRAEITGYAGYLGLVCLDEGEELRTRNYSGELRIQDVQQGFVGDLQSPSTWSLETLNNIRSWLMSCILSHGDCAGPRQEDQLPLRLLDVMPSGLGCLRPKSNMSPEEFSLLSLENLPQLRIVSSANLSPDTSYLTLSHRWGNPQSVLLNKENMFLLHCDISHYILECSEAAVFRHAIHVTRGLGLRYIWIDALCIMQDDKEEKDAEIMRMDAIYSNSTLNISATEGQISKGMNFDRNLLCLNPLRASVQISELRDMHLQVFSDVCYLMESDGSLNRRGWVFQERILAPRVCHFTKNQVFWECNSLEASEVLPQGNDTSSNYGYSSLRSPFPSSLQEIKKRWYDLVDHYSGTFLTFPNDRLIAFSAVAKRFCLGMQLGPEQYLAGMWRDDLPVSMLWWQDMNDSGAPITETNEMEKAPSWSWASLLVSTSSVVVGVDSLEATAKILDVQVTPVSRNFFEGTSTCRLRLRGSICKCRRDFRDGVPWINIGPSPVFREINGAHLARNKVILLEWDSCRSVVTNLLKAHEYLPARVTYSLLHIISDSRPRMERGIILLRTALRGTYTRIGTFSIVHEAGYPGSELEKAFHGGLDTLSKDDYLELQDGKYIIDII